MKFSVVVDVGNTRIKWGLVTSLGIGAAASLSADDVAAWRNQIEEWQLNESLGWVVTGVHPERRDRLVAWLRERKQEITVLNDWRKLPLSIDLERPDTAGMDRLLTAVAANQRRDPETPAIVITAGTAVTVDWLDEGGVFRGGAILPGLHLMARALHQHTAVLPLVQLPCTPPVAPGRTTATAIQGGVFWAVAGGIQALVQQFTARGHRAPHLFLTGGDAPLLEKAWSENCAPSYRAPSVWPWMTLEGIRLAAEALP
jgi:type III pantothenate kinase